MQRRRPPFHRIGAKKSTGGHVRQMPVPPHQSLLQVPWIRASPKHFEIPSPLFLFQRRRNEKRNDLAAVSTVNAKVLDINRDHGMLWMKLAASNETYVRQVGFSIGIASSDLKQARQVV